MVKGDGIENIQFMLNISMMLITVEELSKYKGKTVPCQCEICNKKFNKRKAYLNYSIKRGLPVGKYCSSKCNANSRMNGIHSNTTKIEVECKNCNSIFLKKYGECKRNPNNFCCKSCAVTFNNKHKKYGTRISKLELWLQKELILLYPDLIIKFNSKVEINSELDIFIPSLKLAFELNGIFHYEPIFSNEKLEQIKNNDGRKYQACIENGIELCIIDTSLQKYVKPSTSRKYLNIIINVIDMKTNSRGIDSND